ncbi:MAG: hypothetical protein ACRDVG_12255 [Jatrophihabitantaceae bacterium]
MTDEPSSTAPNRTGQQPAAMPSRLVWLAASPPLVAIPGAALPWFAPTGSGAGHVGLDIPQAFCWQAGRIGFLAPLALVVVGLAVLGPRLGWFGRDQPPRTVRRDGLLIAAAGLFAGLVLFATWLLLPRSYTFGALSWDTLLAAGYHLARGPQAGYFVSVAAAADALGCGVAFVLLGRREVSV